MNWLFLQNNQITGEIDLTRLPEGMEFLCLNNNLLTGSLVIKMLPRWMYMIDLRRNQFSAIAMVHSKTHVTIDLKGSGVKSVVDENGKEQDIGRFMK